MLLLLTVGVVFLDMASLEALSMEEVLAEVFIWGFSVAALAVWLKIWYLAGSPSLGFCCCSFAGITPEWLLCVAGPLLVDTAVRS